MFPPALSLAGSPGAPRSMVGLDNASAGLSRHMIVLWWCTVASWVIYACLWDGPPTTTSSIAGLFSLEARSISATAGVYDKRGRSTGTDTVLQQRCVASHDHYRQAKASSHTSLLALRSVQHAKACRLPPSQRSCPRQTPYGTALDWLLLSTTLNHQ